MMMKTMRTSWAVMLVRGTAEPKPGAVDQRGASDQDRRGHDDHDVGPQ